MRPESPPHGTPQGTGETPAPGSPGRVGRRPQRAARSLRAVRRRGALALSLDIAAGGIGAGAVAMALSGLTTWPSAAVLLAAVVATWLRGTHPVLAWAVCLGCVVALTQDEFLRQFPVLVTLLCLVHVVVFCPVRTAWITSCATLVVALVRIPYDDEALVLAEVATLLGCTGAAAAIGAAFRAHRAYLAEVGSRMRDSARLRAQEAEQRVAQERLRIARDLHDSVGHHLAVVNVQAGLVRRTMRDDPARAEAGIGEVERAVRAAMRETNSAVRVLRSGPDDSAPPKLDQLDALGASWRASGLRVEVRVEGEVRPVDDLIELTAYRLIEESLTNAFKHGTGTAQVSLSYERRALGLMITNAVPATDGGGRDDDGPQARHGLIGMEERVRSVGGELRHGIDPHSLVFCVAARLPLAADDARSGDAP